MAESAEETATGVDDVAPAAKSAAIEAPAAAAEQPAPRGDRKKPRLRRTPPKARPAPADTPAPTMTELKEQIMASAKTADFTKPFVDAMSDLQDKTQSAYDKGAELAAEVTEFAKGNVEALVESGKTYAAGVQDLGKTYAEEAKSAYETLTADMKEMAAVKSPAELFQLQARVARRNFDTLVAQGSRNTDAFVKLVSETLAPISGRISLAAEKISKAA